MTVTSWLFKCQINTFGAAVLYLSTFKAIDEYCFPTNESDLMQSWSLFEKYEQKCIDFKETDKKW